MFMRTERLFLRPPFPEDWREVYSGINDAGVVSMLSRAPWPYMPEDAQAFCSAKTDPLDMRFAITVPGAQGARLIGIIGLDCTQDQPEVGYWLAREFHGQGYATEALRGVLQIARMLGVRRIGAGHCLENPASGAVLMKAGFAATGEVRPVHSLGRGGQLVLARRYAIDLADSVSPEGDMGDCLEDNRKPA
jgi:RimJ/RimL family protein N-acetyltransferase